MQQPNKKKKITAKVVGTGNLNGDFKPKKMFDYENIHTGDDKTNPGVLKAQADKKKRDAILLEKKKKTELKNSKVIKKQQKPK